MSDSGRQTTFWYGHLTCDTGRGHVSHQVNGHTRTALCGIRPDLSPNGCRWEECVLGDGCIGCLHCDLADEAADREAQRV